MEARVGPRVVVLDVGDVAAPDLATVEALARLVLAARRLGFAIGRDGAILPLTGPALGRLKRVAREAFAP